MTAGGVGDGSMRLPVVLAALAGGVAAAMQIGKASAAMPLLLAEFDVSLTAVSSYLSVASLGAALLGLTIGLAAQRFGPLRTGVAGLAILSLASLVGAAATTWPVLFAARIVEAAGTPLVVASMPALVQSACGPARRLVGLGIWAAWLPLGIVLAMFLTVALGDRLGWRALYLGAGILPLLAIAALLLSRPDESRATAAVAATGIRRMPPALLAMAAIFTLFSAIYMTLTGFLPSIAKTGLGFSLDNAALLAGGMALLIVVGNLLATVLLVRGIPAQLVLALAFATMGVSAGLFLFDGLPVLQRILAGVVFNVAAGVAPGVIWTYVPLLSQRLGLGAALISGVFYQASGVGQFAGPLLGGLAVDVAGNWLACLAVMLPCALAAIWLSLGSHVTPSSTAVTTRPAGPAS